MSLKNRDLAKYRHLQTVSDVVTHGSHSGGSAGLDRGDISVRFPGQFPDFDIVLHIQEETVRHSEEAAQTDGSQ